MKLHYKLATAIFLFSVSFLQAQETVKGIIYEETPTGKSVPLPGANVYWLDSAVGAITNEKGWFQIPYRKKYEKLVISYVGFKTDTINVSGATEIKHWLLPADGLNEIVLSNRRQTAFKSFLQAQNITNISSAELLKAACCNLAESFETNPSIDVNFPDALTGNRQIRMLGLTSPYTLITLENIPAIRGAAQSFGLSFVPGTWVESIQISKGAGSVVNGYESIAGQINAELQKPSTDEDFFLNAYAGSDGRFELNNHLNFKLSEKWHTGLYLHGNLRDTKMDENIDGFMDMPLARQVNVMNRWEYKDPQKGWVSFFNLKYLKDEKQTGQVAFNPEFDKFTTNAWGSEIFTTRAEASAKIGYVFPEIPYQSMSFQAAYSDHEQDSYFGLNVFDIRHKSFYSTAFLSSIIGDSRHNFKTGISFTFDEFSENVNTQAFDRTERSAGAFFEYAYDDLGDITLTAGLRIDAHNLLGTFVTPRFHFRYTPWEKAAFKASFGRGKRSAVIFAENQQLFNSERLINIASENGPIYGLNPEVAWNYGLSFLQGFSLGGRDGDIAVDFYRTDFTDQVVVDWEDPQKVSFYNLDGKSFANSFQTEINYSLFKNTDLRLSYRLLDVKTDYQKEMLQKPLTSKHRFFANASYETPSSGKGGNWRFDATYNWYSKQRFPNTEENPPAYRLPEFSKSINTLNAQVTKVFSLKFEVYIGGENITNVRQDNPVLSAEDPFSGFFDATYVYGPVFGSMYYVGLRWKL